MNNMQLIMTAIRTAGRSIPVVDMALATGLDVKTVRRAMENAKARGYIREVPATFLVTSAGDAAMHEKRPGRPRKVQPKGVVASPLPKPPEPPPPKGPCMVTTAIANRRPIEAAWGGANA